MNKEIRKERIEAEIDRAKEALTAAKNLFEDGAICRFNLSGLLCYISCCKGGSID